MPLRESVAALGCATPSPPGIAAGTVGRRVRVAAVRGGSMRRVASGITNISGAPVKSLNHRRLPWQSAICARTQARAVPELAFCAGQQFSTPMVRATVCLWLGILGAFAAERAQL